MNCFLHHIVMSDIRHEKELIAMLMNDYHTKYNADTYPPVTCVDYRDAPMSISVGHWEGFRGICGIDDSKLFQELERGETGRRFREERQTGTFPSFLAV